MMHAPANCTRLVRLLLVSQDVTVQRIRDTYSLRRLRRNYHHTSIQGGPKKFTTSLRLTAQLYLEIIQNNNTT